MPSRFQQIDVIDDRAAEILRQMTAAEKLAIADRMWRFAQQMLRTDIVKEQTHFTEAAIEAEVAGRISHPDFEEECYRKIPLSLFL